jgi:hypothetical protein
MVWTGPESLAVVRQLWEVPHGEERAHSAGGCGGRHIRRGTAMSGSIFAPIGAAVRFKLCGCSSSPLPDDTSVRWLLGHGYGMAHTPTGVPLC